MRDKNNIQSIATISFLTITVISILFPEIALAGTGGEELQGIYEKTVELAQGYGGKTVAAISFIGAMIGAIRGSLVGFLTPLGISIAAGVGPSMVTSGISALM